MKKKNTFTSIAVMLMLFCTWRVDVSAAEPQEVTLKIMSYNIWVDGRPGKQPVSQTVKVIEEAEADVVGMQEVSDEKIKEIARLLGWNYKHSGWKGLLTRHEITETCKQGIKIRTNSGREAYVFNTHLKAAPYQPYQLLNIPYAEAPFLKTEEEAVAAAQAVRGQQLADLIYSFNALKDKELPVFLVGDFNEPSHRDWTEAAANAGRHPIKVAYPASLAMQQAGFVDAYRAIYPDEMKHPGYTWTPTTKPDDPKDHHDRIDFVYFRGEGVKVQSAGIVGENKTHADLVVTPYPSDHRAVVATFRLDKVSEH